MNKRDAALKNWAILELILTIIGIIGLVFTFAYLQELVQELGPSNAHTGALLTIFVVGFVLFARGNILYTLMQTLGTKEQQLIDQKTK